MRESIQDVLSINTSWHKAFHNCLYLVNHKTLLGIRSVIGQKSYCSTIDNISVSRTGTTATLPLEKKDILSLLKSLSQHLWSFNLLSWKNRCKTYDESTEVEHIPLHSKWNMQQFIFSWMLFLQKATLYSNSALFKTCLNPVTRCSSGENVELGL